MQNLRRAAPVVTFPGLERATIQARVMQAVAQVDEVALAEFKLKRNLLIFDVFDFRGGVMIEGRRHRRIGEGHRKSAEDRGELLVQVPRFEIAHLDQITVRVLANLVPPMPALGCGQEHASLHITPGGQYESGATVPLERWPSTVSVNGPCRGAPDLQCGPPSRRRDR